MPFVDNINYEKTFSKRKLVLKTKWLDVADSVVFYFAAIFFFVCLYLTYKELNLANPNDQFIAHGVLPLAGLFAIALLYKKITEKRLLIIETPLNKVQTRQLIRNAVKSWGWNVRSDNANYLQATTGFEFSWGKQVTILFDSGKLYLNVMSDNPMVRMPVLFSDRSIRYDIKKLLEASTQHSVSRNGS